MPAAGLLGSGQGVPSLGHNFKSKVWGKSSNSKQQVNAIRGPEILTCKNGLQLFSTSKNIVLK